MKRVVGPAVVVFVVCSLVELGGQTHTPAPAEQARDADEIVRLLHEWGEAMARRDAPALGRMLADDFTFVSPRGRLMNKAAYVANRDASGRVAIETSRFDDVSVRFFGGVAVATSRYTSRSRSNAAGVVEEMSGEYARTDTLTRADGRWQAVATQLTPIGYAGAHAAADSAALHGLNDEELSWSDSPTFPGARFAVLDGTPYTGGYVIRMKRPDRHVERPHHHESDEHLSVISGVVHVAVGEGCRRASARTFRAGGHVAIPARTLHCSWAEGDVTEDVHWTGPAAPVYAQGPR